MAKKIIAVVPLWDETKNSVWMLPGYLDGIREAGGIPVILPIEGEKEDYEALLARCDGLLMTGGHDVSPLLYGEEITDKCGTLCEARDRIEPLLYKKALGRDMPVLGICRGIQMINAVHGGTLYQDLPAEQEKYEVNHHMEPPYTDVAHEVTIRKDSQLYRALGTTRLGVNSCHHQGIRKLGSGLEVMAEADDGLVEAVRATGRRFVWAVQWHPEFSLHSSPASLKIFTAFVQACG